MQHSSSRFYAIFLPVSIVKSREIRQFNRLYTEKKNKRKSFGEGKKTKVPKSAITHQKIYQEHSLNSSVLEKKTIIEIMFCSTIHIKQTKNLIQTINSRTCMCIFVRTRFGVTRR